MMIRPGAALAAALALTAFGSGSARAQANPFEIAAAGRVLAAAFLSGPQAGPVLTVFIEGDGLAHDGAGRPTRDPTPRRADSRRIGDAWPSDGPKVWLGRLCQYVRARDPACRPEDWTRERFSVPAVAATNAALDQLKARAGARRLVLVGWSGGGTLAALAAARRQDVDALVTLSAPLDLEAWTTTMRVSPLPPEGDPARIFWGARPARQLHLFGGRDRTVPAAGQLAAARAMGGTTAVWAGMGHAGWARRADDVAAALRRPEP
jgi:pimeloyl-ACP methyl ester carboxylesterase